MGSHSLPFNIRQVADLLPLTIRHYDPTRYQADCFLCEREGVYRKGKLKIYFTEDVWCCGYCKRGGGMLQLYAAYKNISVKQANSDIREDLRLGNTVPYMPGALPKRQSVISPLANIEARHNTYSRLLDLLVLTEKHRQNLLSRGLSGEQIEQFKFKSVPIFGVPQIAQKLINQGCTLTGIPGFYQKNGAWNISFFAPGYLVPFPDDHGRIQAFQIALDKPIENSKYMWLSSVSYDCGVSSGSPTLCLGPPAKVIYIAEGGVKSYVTHALSGKTLYGIAGSGCIKSLYPLLMRAKGQGTAEAIVLYDMDKYKNQQVMKDLGKLIDLIRECGLSPRILDWCGAFNGIDDYLFARTLLRNPA